MELRHIIKQGRSIIPVAANKQAMVDWKEYGRRLPRPDEIERWIASSPPRWAVVTGFLSRLVTLDFDGEAGLERMRRLGLKPHRRTPHGCHVDFEWEGSALKTGALEPGVDVRGENGYIIVLGEGYDWLPDYRPRRTLPSALDVRRLRVPFEG